MEFVQLRSENDGTHANFHVHEAVRARKLVLACCCYPPYMRGGGEVANRRLALALHGAGYELTVISIGDVDSREIIDGIPVIRLRSTNVHWLYRSKDASKPVKALWHVLDAVNWPIAKYIGALLDEINPDCLITSTLEDISTFTWREAKKRGIRTIDILHSYYLLCYSGSMFREGRNCAQQCAGCAMLCYPKKINTAYVDDVVGVSAFVLNKHIERGLFENARKHVIPNIGFDTPSQSTGTDSNRSAHKKISGVEKRESPLRIGYLGRLHRTKGIHRIIEAVMPLQRDHFEIVIAGEGDDDYKRQLQLASEALGIALRFIGHVPPADLFAQIDYLVVPSEWQEPFGLVITEAARAGVPVITARSGGMPEIVSADMGVCFASVEELSALFSRLSSERPQFSFASLHRFDKDNIVEQWRKLLENIPLRTLA